MPIATGKMMRGAYRLQRWWGILALTAGKTLALQNFASIKTRGRDNAQTVSNKGRRILGLDNFIRRRAGAAI